MKKLPYLAFCLALTLMPIHDGVNANYLQNSPIKLLNVKTVATRSPASDSEFRINVVNGEVSIRCLKKNWG